MALKKVNIGSLQNVHQYDDGTFTHAVEVEGPIKCTAPVDNDDAVRLAEISDMVDGPASSTDNAIARFDGASGQLLQDSSLLLDDSGNLSKNVDDLELDCGANKTLVLVQDVWDDVRVVPGSFTRPGSSDPTLRTYTPGGAGTATYLYEFAKGDIVTFMVQIPHKYKEGEDISVHLHWTPGDNGAGESGNYVGWKVDYSWANVDGTFGSMATADLSDVCDGTDHKHQMTPEVTITGTGKDISSMLMCNLKRTDTGADDTWAGSGTGNLPMILEVDFHFPIDTIGSRQQATK